jgi:hypothetical protein
MLQNLLPLLLLLLLLHLLLMLMLGQVVVEKCSARSVVWRFRAVCRKTVRF